VRPPGDPEVLTSSEAAALLGISVDAVIARARRGRLRAVKTPGGFRWRFSRSAVQALAAERVWLARRREQVRRVPCPQCGALAGRRCHTPSGHEESVSHQARVRAAGDAGVYVP
jgi:excisionase family DNA binding protein